MEIPVLCVVQARLKSTRLPEKMLQTLDGQALIERAWQASCAAFRYEHVIIAMPECDKGTALDAHTQAMLAQVYFHPGDERDVLGRFVAVAHLYRWHPDSRIFRVTADDPYKDPDAMIRVANGERLDVERGGECFTLAMLDETDRRTRSIATPEARWHMREHLTHSVFATDPPLPPDVPKGRVWTIDTQEDLDAVRAAIAQQHQQHEQRRG